MTFEIIVERSQEWKTNFNSPLGNCNSNVQGHGHGHCLCDVVVSVLVSVVASVSLPVVVSLVEINDSVLGGGGCVNGDVVITLIKYIKSQKSLIVT